MSMATGARPSKMTGDVIPKGYQAGQLSQFTPEQMQLFQNTFAHVQPGSYLSKLAQGDQGSFDQLEAPVLRQFQGLQGQIASRFSGQGMGARHSSGFQNATNQASSDFSQQLQSQRMGIQRQALQDLMGISGELLGQRPYDKFMVPKEKPWWQDLVSGLVPGLASAGASFGGTAGSMALGKKWGIYG